MTAIFIVDPAQRIALARATNFDGRGKRWTRLILFPVAAAHSSGMLLDAELMTSPALYWPRKAKHRLARVLERDDIGLTKALASCFVELAGSRAALTW